jgi:hypothetical protein
MVLSRFFGFGADWDTGQGLKEQQNNLQLLLFYQSIKFAVGGY